MSDANFFEKVYNVVMQIPSGKVTSYGAIARYIGAPGAARMVGWALTQSHLHEQIVPAHRVVNRNGMLSGKGHFRHPDLMQELLESEGVEVSNDKVVDFANSFWDPNIELV